MPRGVYVRKSKHQRAQVLNPETLEWEHPPAWDSYVEWYVDPERSTLRRWCDSRDDLDVKYQTVARWHWENPAIKRMIEHRFRELNVNPHRIQKVIDAMFKEAERGDVRAAQLVMGYVDRLAPMKQPEPEDTDVEKLSDDELRAQLQAAMGNG